MPPMESLSFNIKTEKRHIAYASFIIEAYDGIAVVRTADPEAALPALLPFGMLRTESQSMSGFFSCQMLLFLV